MKKAIAIICMVLNSIFFGYNLGIKNFGFGTWIQAIGIIATIYLLNLVKYNPNTYGNKK